VCILQFRFAHEEESIMVKTTCKNTIHTPLTSQRHVCCYSYYCHL